MLRFLRALAALVLFTVPAFAAVTATPVFVQTPSIGVQQFIQGTDTAGTFKTLYTGGANGSKCSALMAVSNDGSASHVLTVEIIHSTTTPILGYTIGTAASNGVYGAPVNLMSSTNWPGLPLDADGNPYFYLANGDTLKATFATALTSTDQINFVAVCADF